MSEALGHIPLPVVVNVKSTKPTANSAAVGEYVAPESVVLLGLNIPAPPDQIPPKAAVTEPVRVVTGF